MCVMFPVVYSWPISRPEQTIETGCKKSTFSVTEIEVFDNADNIPSVFFGVSMPKKPNVQFVCLGSAQIMFFVLC